MSLRLIALVPVASGRKYKSANWGFCELNHLAARFEIGTIEKNMSPIYNDLME